MNVSYVKPGESLVPVDSAKDKCLVDKSCIGFVITESKQNEAALMYKMSSPLLGAAAYQEFSGCKFDMRLFNERIN